MRVALFFLHDAESSGNDIRTYLNAVPLEQHNFQTFKQVLVGLGWDIFTPTATDKNYAPAHGERRKVWFDRTREWDELGRQDTYEDLIGVDQSLDQIVQQVDNIAADYDAIFIGGFGMGGSIALHMLQRMQNIVTSGDGIGKSLPSNVCGLFALHSHLVEASVVYPSLGSGANPGTFPILMLHGTGDGVVLSDWGKETATDLLLHNMGSVQFLLHNDIPHEIDNKELCALLNWCKDITCTLDSANISADGKVGASSSETGHKGGASKDIDDENETPEEHVRKHKAEAKHSSSNSYQTLPPAGAKATGNKKALVASYPYLIEYLKGDTVVDSLDLRGTCKSRIIYPNIPNDMIAGLTNRPILACGGMFDIEPSLKHNGVQTIVTSAYPEKTAIEIGHRLKIRISSGSSSLNPCPMQ